MTPSKPESIDVRCKAVPLWYEWGSWLSLWLGAFGIGKREADWILWRLRINRGCGCRKREAVLNKAGGWFASLVRLAVERSRAGS